MFQLTPGFQNWGQAMQGFNNPFFGGAAMANPGMAQLERPPVSAPAAAPMAAPQQIPSLPPQANLAANSALARNMGWLQQPLMQPGTPALAAQPQQAQAPQNGWFARRRERLQGMSPEQRQINPMLNILSLMGAR